MSSRRRSTKPQGEAKGPQDQLCPKAPSLPPRCTRLGHTQICPRLGPAMVKCWLLFKMGKKSSTCKSEQGYPCTALAEPPSAASGKPVQGDSDPGIMAKSSESGHLWVWSATRFKINSDFHHGKYAPLAPYRCASSQVKLQGHTTEPPGRMASPITGPLTHSRLSPAGKWLLLI